MAEIIWAPGALDDIDAIAANIARDSGYHASLFVDRLFEVADLLKEQPGTGRVIPEIGNPDCQEIIYGSCRLMYRIRFIVFDSIFGALYPSRMPAPVSPE